MNSIEKSLTTCEQIVMKVVWDAKEDVRLQDAIVQLKERYNKDYARTTVATFLKHLEDKGYVSTYRVGRIAYIHAEVDFEKYRQKLAQEDADFWFEGNVPEMIAALVGSRKLSKDEVAEIKKLADGLKG